MSQNLQFHIKRSKGRIDYKPVDHIPPVMNPEMDGADNLIMDNTKVRNADTSGTFWQGPSNKMPQGFILEFLEDISLDNIVFRNGKTSEWKCGTKDFEILLGRTEAGPWIRVAVQ